MGFCQIYRSLEMLVIITITILIIYPILFEFIMKYVFK